MKIYELSYYGLLKTKWSVMYKEEIVFILRNGEKKEISREDFDLPVLNFILKEAKNSGVVRIKEVSNG